MVTLSQKDQPSLNGKPSFNNINTRNLPNIASSQLRHLLGFNLFFCTVVPTCLFLFRIVLHHIGSFVHFYGLWNIHHVSLVSNLDSISSVSTTFFVLNLTLGD